MKPKKMLKYLLYALVIFGFLLLSQHVIKEYRRIASLTYNASPYIYATIFSSILMGALIGLETPLREAGKRGKWQVNSEKMLFVGLPSLYFTFKSLIPLPIFSQTPSLPFLLYADPETIFIAAIIFGFTLSSSFYKEDFQSIKGS